MRILLDSHAFIWWDSQPDKLSPAALAACRDRANTLLLSIASVWEIQIKIQLGKLKLKIPFSEVMNDHLKTNNIEMLAITLPHIFALQNLPMHHKDPFDRLLIAQANIENIAVVSNDLVFSQYPVKLLW